MTATESGLTPEQERVEAELFCSFCDDHGDPQDWTAQARGEYCAMIAAARLGVTR